MFGFHSTLSNDNNMLRDFYDNTDELTNFISWFDHMEDRPGWGTALRPAWAPGVAALIPWAVPPFMRCRRRGRSLVGCNRTSRWRWVVTRPIASTRALSCLAMIGKCSLRYAARPQSSEGTRSRVVQTRWTCRRRRMVEG